jgi:hypothetical protein
MRTQPSLLEDVKRHQRGLMVELILSGDPFYPLAEARRRLSSESNAEDSKKTLGLLAYYAKLFLTRQQRTHLFQLVIFGSNARFLRWDHTGVVISEPFDYVQESTYLVDFLWRYSHMDSTQKGWDKEFPTAMAKREQRFCTVIDSRTPYQDGWHIHGTGILVLACGTVHSIFSDEQSTHKPELYRGVTGESVSTCRATLHVCARTAEDLSRTKYDALKLYLQHAGHSIVYPNNPITLSSQFLSNLRDSVDSLSSLISCIL